MDDFSKLNETEHMLKWLADEPYSTIKSDIEGLLRKQVAGARLTSFRVLSAPQWLTGARRMERDSNKTILVRTGVAFEFELSVTELTGPTQQLRGVYSWVGVNLDDAKSVKTRIWFDLDATLEIHGSQGVLMGRMHFENDEA